jgi:DNA-binding CsgD family transcriptional regulator
VYDTVGSLPYPRATVAGSSHARGVAWAHACCGRPHVTARQGDVLRLLAVGMGTVEISEALNISAHTVTHHIGRLLHLSGAGNRTELVSRAYVLGIIDPHSWPPRLTSPCSALG